MCLPDISIDQASRMNPLTMISRKGIVTATFNSKTITYTIKITVKQTEAAYYDVKM